LPGSDRAIEVFARHGIKFILGTPSYSQPAWLWQKYPDTGATDKQGISYRFGTRQQMNLVNSHYIDVVRGIVTAMGEHYRDNQDVIGFSIDNEIGPEVEELWIGNLWLPRR